MLSELSQKDKYSMIRYMWNLKKKKLRERTDMWLPEMGARREKWLKETKGLKTEKSKIQYTMEQH